MSEIIESKLTPKAYLSSLKSRFGFPLALSCERVTGVIIGRFFSVAYYCPWEWNRRITGECNRAFGYVKKTDGASEIYFVRSRGMFSPFWIIFWFLFCAVFCLVELGELSIFLGCVCTAISLTVCGISAFQDSLTEEGQNGAGVITSLLEKPDEFYYC